MQGLSSCVVAKGVVVTEVDATTSCTFEGDSGRGSCNYCCPTSTSCPRAVSFPFLKSSSTVHSCADQCWCRATPMLRLCGWIWRWSRRLWSNLIGAWGAQLSKSFQQRRALLQLPLVYLVSNHMLEALASSSPSCILIPLISSFLSSLLVHLCSIPGLFQSEVANARKCSNPTV